MKVKRDRQRKPDILHELQISGVDMQNTEEQHLGRHQNAEQMFYTDDI